MGKMLDRTPSLIGIKIKQEIDVKKMVMTKRYKTDAYVRAHVNVWTNMRAMFFC